MRALVTGATGFIGRALLKRLERPVVLSRDAARARVQVPGVEVYGWDPLGGPPPLAALAGIDTVFHLAGDPVVDGRWNDDKKRRVRDSRVVGTRNLVDGLAAAATVPRVLVSASAVGYYGSRGDVLLDERAEPGGDFLAEVCMGWEQAALKARELGLRVALPRIGVVLGPGGGPLKKMLTPFKLGLGGRLASGQQWFPWVHLDDIVGLLLHAAERETVQGPMNAVAPHPVTNREFTTALAAALHRPAIFPVPAFALRLAFGEAAEILLASQRVVPGVAQQTGYGFRYPDLRPALAAIFGDGRSAT